MRHIVLNSHLPFASIASLGTLHRRVHRRTPWYSCMPYSCLHSRVYWILSASEFDVSLYYVLYFIPYIYTYGLPSCSGSARKLRKGVTPWSDSQPSHCQKNLAGCNTRSVHRCVYVDDESINAVHNLDKANHSWLMTKHITSHSHEEWRSPSWEITFNWTSGHHMSYGSSKRDETPWGACYAWFCRLLHVLRQNDFKCFLQNPTSVW